MLLYLCDQQLYVLFEAVQESLQGAGVGSAALPSPNFWQPSMFVLNLGQNLCIQCGEKYEMSLFYIMNNEKYSYTDTAKLCCDFLSLTALEQLCSPLWFKECP